MSNNAWERPGQQQLRTQVDDAKCKQAFEDINKNYWDWQKKVEIYKAVEPYILSQAWWIPIAADLWYNIWQPWVKGYHGEEAVGHTDFWNFMQ